MAEKPTYEELEKRVEALEKEIAENKYKQGQLLHDAFHDKVTALPNRALLLDRIEKALQRRRRADSSFGVILLNIDRFRAIIDSFGHRAGDQLLAEVAQRLKRCSRRGDTVARLGGDEFSMLLHDIDDPTDIIRIADRTMNRLSSPLRLGEQDLNATASMGIVLSTESYGQPEDILRDAQMALRRAKARGKACYEIFEKAMHEHAVARLQMENDLRVALKRQEFFVLYQPIVCLKTGMISGFEALVRWQHPERGVISPLEFIPVAETSGVIIPLGLFVLRTACNRIRQWQDTVANVAPLSMSVNLSGRQFSQPDLLYQIHKTLKDNQMPSGSLMLEITESVVMRNAELATAVARQLKGLEVRLAIDDFGTGYSSLSYLHRFPVDMLKVDRTFVGKMGDDAKNLEIVRTIVALARNLGMNVTAEGIETTEQLAQLKALQCEYGQGFFFSRPVDEEKARTMLTSRPQWEGFT